MAQIRLEIRQKNHYNLHMRSYFDDIAIVIPALDPDERMTDLVRELHGRGFKHIILVDDGSRDENRLFFDICKDEFDCHVIRHVVNLGKGTALKSAFNHILTNMPFILGAVTADSDGQHLADDIERCAALIPEHEDSLILGCREFDDDRIPLRSRFGNKLTRLTLKLLCGLGVSDTQTGLRGLPKALLSEHFASTKGERFEYEMNMLLQARDYHIPIVEFKIKTIYLEHNESSHFNPFRDSIRIYKVFLKFMLSSFSSFLIDICLYWVLGILLRHVIPPDVTVHIFGLQASLFIVLRTVIARVCSSIYNFLMNKNQVFKNDSRSPVIAIKYFFLAIVQLMLSALLVNHLLLFIPYSTARKVIIDTLLFAISFLVQREWVFRIRHDKNQ